MNIKYVKTLPEYATVFNPNAIGVTDHDTKTIYIKKSGSFLEDVKTLFHEVFHLLGIDKRHRLGELSFKGGGGGSPPPPPAIPEYNPEKDYQAYIKFGPQVAQTQVGVAPLYAQSELDLIKRYGGDISQALYNTEAKVYPYSTGLQEQLGKVSSERLSGGLPAELKDYYRDQFRAEVGNQAGSPIGAFDVTKNLIGLGEDYNRYYQNLGLSLTGRIPITAPGGPNAKYTPDGMSMDAQLQAGSSAYGSRVNAMANIYGSQVQGWAAGRKQGGGSSGIGAGLGMLSSMFFPGGMKF